MAKLIRVLGFLLAVEGALIGLPSALGTTIDLASRGHDVICWIFFIGMLLNVFVVTQVGLKLMLEGEWIKVQPKD